MLLALLSILYFVIDSFTGRGITDAVIVHALYGYEQLQIGQFKTLIFSVVLACITTTLICFYFIRFAHNKNKYNTQTTPKVVKRITTMLSYSLLFFCITAHPAIVDIVTLYTKYQKALTSETRATFSLNLKPISVEINPSVKQKNIVYIYAESLENTFFNEAVFPGLMQHLKPLKQKAIRFNNIHEVQLTDWTIAGMTATQCGMPLSTFKMPNTSKENKHITSGQLCVGDILSSAGYQLVYIGGASKQFAGKGRFYQDHQFNEILSLEEHTKNLPADTAVSQWGIYDDDLFKIVFAKYQTLLAQSKPFGLFTLTLDTHPPEGYKTPACKNIKYADGSNPMLNSVACADFLIADLVMRMQSLPGSENTLFIIGSDHLMKNSSATELLKSTIRKNFLMVLNADTPSILSAKPASSLDVGPTILHLAGFHANNLALGRNILSETPTLLADMGFQKFNRQVYDWRVNLISLYSKKL